MLREQRSDLPNCGEQTCAQIHSPGFFSVGFFFARFHRTCLRNAKTEQSRAVHRISTVPTRCSGFLPVLRAPTPLQLLSSPRPPSAARLQPQWHKVVCLSRAAIPLCEPHQHPTHVVSSFIGSPPCSYHSTILSMYTESKRSLRRVFLFLAYDWPSFSWVWRGFPSKNHGFARAARDCSFP